MATPSIKRKTVVTDPEGNKITTKTRKTNLFGQKGSSKTIIKYTDPVSSGKKRDVKYTDAPVPSDEELGIKKKGGVTKMKTKKYANGGPKLSKYQKKGEVTPFQNYMNVPGAMASDTSDVFAGSRDGSNPPLDKAYYETYYAGQKDKRRVGNDKIKYDANGKRIYKTGGMVNANAKIAAAKKATGRSGGTTKAISKVVVKSTSPKGRVGGTSTAPKKALPKAQMGAIVNGPKSPGGKPKAGGAILKKTDPTLGGRIPKSFIGKGTPKAGGLILKNMSKSKMGGMKGKSC
jgi:hypothetical protein